MGSTGRGIVTSTDVYNQTARLDAQLREGLITSEQRDAAMAALNTAREAGDRITESSIKPSSVTINDDYYRTVVGRPSGRGRWAFFPDRGRNDIDNAIFVDGSYPEAKKKARQEAARRGWRNLYTGT